MTSDRDRVHIAIAQRKARDRLAVEQRQAADEAARHRRHDAVVAATDDEVDQVMAERQRGTAEVGDSLASVLARAVERFEDPENQRLLAQRQRDEAARQAAQRAARDDAERDRLRSIPRLQKLGVPVVVAELLVNGPIDVTTCVRLMRAQRRDIIALAGNTGCGKTSAACEPLLAGEGALWLATDLARLRPDTWLQDREEMRRLEQVPYLVIDDVGQEQDRRGEFPGLFDALISKRAGNRQRTAITTNLTADEFERKFGSRVWSRLHQAGEYHEIDDPDLRVVRLSARGRP